MSAMSKKIAPVSIAKSEKLHILNHRLFAFTKKGKFIIRKGRAKKVRIIERSYLTPSIKARSDMVNPREENVSMYFMYMTKRYSEKIKRLIERNIILFCSLVIALSGKNLKESHI